MPSISTRQTAAPASEARENRAAASFIRTRQLLSVPRTHSRLVTIASKIAAMTQYSRNQMSGCRNGP